MSKSREAHSRESTGLAALRERLESCSRYSLGTRTKPRTNPGCPSPARDGSETPEWRDPALALGCVRGAPQAPRQPPCPSQPPTSCSPSGVSLAAPAMAALTSHPVRHLRARGGAAEQSRAERSGAEGQRAVSSPPSQRPGGAKAPALPSRPGTGDPPPRPTEPPRPVSPTPPRPLRGESSGAAAGGHSSTGCGVQGTGIEGAGAVLIQPQNATSVPCRDARFPDMQGCRTVADSNAVSWTEITQEPLLSRDTLRGILPLGGLESVRGCPGRRWRQRPWSC